MKTQITSSTTTLKPITISITIETKEELGCFLDLTNSPASLARDMEDDHLNYASSEAMRSFLDGLAPSSLFGVLSAIYSELERV